MSFLLYLLFPISSLVISYINRVYSQSNRKRTYYFSSHISCHGIKAKFLRLGHHSGLHRHFSGLHSWIFFYSRVLLLAFIAIDFFVSRSALIPRDQVFLWKMLENSGTPSFSFCINVSHKVYDDSWIIDSGATDHMTSKS